MRLCLACYKNRLAVLFDNAGEFRIYDVAGNQISPAGQLSLPFDDLPSKVSSIVSCGVNTLICGGISGCTLQFVAGTNIEVIPWICGEIDTVLQAWQNKALEELAMPGCRGQCRGLGHGKGQGRGRRFGTGRQNRQSRTNQTIPNNLKKDIL